MVSTDERPLDTAKLIADELERQIISNYRLLPTNVAAATMLGRSFSDDEQQLWTSELTQESVDEAKQALHDRLVGSSEDLQQKVLKAYAAPLLNKLFVRAFSSEMISEEAS